MSKQQNREAKQNDNVVAMPSKCPVAGCSHMAKRAEFCQEHFVWFKEGLINKKGERPKDFDKKYQAFLYRKAA